MYKVTLYDRGSYPDGVQVLLDTSSQTFEGVTSATYEGKLNEAGSFTFGIAMTHSLYETIEPLKTYVSVEEDGDEIFWGRVIMVRKSPLTGVKQVTCEGALAFLLDAELAPDSDVQTKTVKDYFTFCVSAYNSAIGNDKARNLISGTVTVRKQNESVDFKNGSWTPIQSVIKSKLVDTRDGFLRIRKKEDSYEHYLDWVRQVGNENPQTIQITQNVINQTSTESGEDIFTYVRGLGKDNLSYGPVRLSQDMETKYGKIIRTITFGDVESQSELQTKVEDYIDKLKNRISLSADISFVDMHYLDGTSPKVKLGDVFTNLSGYEGTKYTAASLTKDLLNPANDKMTPKTDKDLMPSITSSGANSGSATGSVSGRRSFSGGSSHWYKHIHETEEDLALTARNIEITAEENIRLLSARVDIQADNLSSLSGRVVTIEGKWTTFEGTGLYQNRQSIDAVAGKFMIDNSGTLLLKSGTQFKLDANGSSTNVGHLLVVDDNRGKTHDVGQLLASYAGSYSYQNDSELGAIVGRYQLDTTVDPANPWTEVTPASGASTDGINPQERGWWVKNSNGKYVRTTDTTVVSGRKYYIPNSQTKVVFDTGAGYKIRENGSEWGIYTEGSLTAGIIVGKVNDDSTVQINANRIYLNGNTIANRIEATDANFNNLVSGSTKATTINVGALNGDTVTGGTVYATTQLSIGSGTGSGSGSLYYRGEQFYRQGLLLGNLGSIAAAYVLGNGSKNVSLDHYHKIVATEGTGADAGKIILTLSEPVATSDTTNSTTNFNIAATTTYRNGVLAARNAVAVNPFTANVVTGAMPDHRTFTYTTDAPTPAAGTSQSDTWYLSGGTTWTNNKTNVGLHYGSETGTPYAQLEVDASDLVSDATTAGINTGKASVGLNDLTWTPTGATLPESQEITARTTGRTTSTLQEIEKTLSLSLAKGTTWSTDNKLTVTLKAGSGLTPIAATEVDATDLVTNATYAGKASVGLSNVTWQYDPVYILNYNRLTIKTNGRTDSTGARDELTVRETLYLVQGEWDSNNSVDVTLRRGTSSGDAYARITVNASDLTLDAERRGRAAVNITDFWWSDPGSSGLPSSRTIYAQTTGRTNTSGETDNITKDLTLKLVQGSTWSDDYKLTVTLKSGSNTSYEETTVDASSIVSDAETSGKLAGKKSVTLQDPVWTDPPTSGNLGTSCNIRVKTSGRTGTGIENLEKNVGMSLSSSGLTVYMKWGNTQVGKITCSPSITLPTSVSTSSTATTGVDKEYSASRSANYIYFTVTSGGTSKKIQIHLLNA